METMIAAASYNVFNAEEHLLHSLRTMRPLVEHINLVVQSISNIGIPSDGKLFDVIEQARSEKLFDLRIDYAPDFSLPPVLNEFRKRTLGFNAAVQSGASHFMTMDCDEYYVCEEFMQARDFIERENIKASAAATYLHIKRPIWRSQMPDVTCVSFLTDITGERCFEFDGPFPPGVPTDPTRRVNGNAEPFYLFPPDVLAMRHMNLVRHSLDSKIKNSSNAHMVDFMKEVRKSYDNWAFGHDLNFPNKPPLKIIEVPDLFMIDKYFS